jgi:hypothetical protein
MVARADKLKQPDKQELAMQKKIFPDFVPPMMTQSAKESFDSRDWII